MPQSYCNLLYHVVFSTRDWNPWIDSELAALLYPYLGAAIRDEGGIAILINGMPDYVHILMKLRQDHSVADVVRAIKSNSSGWIHKTRADMKGFAWQAGYGAFTVSASQVSRVKAYIANQQEHHRTKSFKEEFVGFLKAQGIEFDPEYVWK